MINNKILSALGGLISLLTLKCYAIDFDHESIRQFVKMTVESNITPPDNGKMDIVIAPIDSRIGAKSCQRPLDANIPENHNGRNVNIKISCADSNGWHMYVPVKIKAVVPVLVATTPLNKGTIVSGHNTAIEYISIYKLRGQPVNNIDEIKGARLKRRMSKGSTISHGNVCMVCKGEDVTIVATSNSFTIKTAGIALKDGSLGQQVSVRNEKSGRKVKGRVEGINQVVINL